MKNLNLELSGLVELSAEEQLKINGGGICIACIQGLFDSKRKTTFKWGCCPGKKSAV